MGRSAGLGGDPPHGRPNHRPGSHGTKVSHITFSRKPAFLMQNLRKLLILSLAAPCLTVASPAKAVLNYYIYQDGPDVKIDVAGTLALPQKATNTGCPSSTAGQFYYINSSNIICTGPGSVNLDQFRTSPNTDLTILPTSPLDASSSTATTSFSLAWGPGYTSAIGSGLYGIQDVASAITGISSSSVYSNKNLATDFGLTTLGLFTSFTLLPNDSSDPYTANDTINIYVGPPPAPTPSVPGPIPVIGAWAAYAFSRRIRSRIRSL